MILAEAQTPEYVNVVGIITSLGFAIWYGWYVTTRTIPKIVEDHRSVVDKLVETFREEQKEERQNFRAALDVIACRYPKSE